MAQLDKRIVLPEALRNPHPLVKKSAEILKSSKPDVTGIIEPTEEEKGPWGLLYCNYAECTK